MMRNIAAAISATLMVLGVAVGAAQAGPPTNVSVTVTANVSTGGVSPTSNGANYFFDYHIAAGLAVTDLIPVEICAAITQAGDGAGYPMSLEVGNSGAGGNLPGVTHDASVGFNGNGCQTIYIDIATGALAEGDFNKVVAIKKGTEPDNKTQVSIDTPNIHIRVHVTEARSTSCFITDSEFQFLLDCAGNAVTSGDGGRFAIVTNKKGVQVATNPGQFYYNILWTNTTGSDKTVKVNLARFGVRPQGAQAIHAKLFPSFPTVDAATFAAVNDSIPGGADDNLENVVVPAGWTLWVDYHLEWGALGSIVSSAAANACGAANQTFSVIGTVSDATTNDVLGTCTAGAAGYKK